MYSNFDLRLAVSRTKFFAHWTKIPASAPGISLWDKYEPRGRNECKVWITLFFVSLHFEQVPGTMATGLNNLPSALITDVIVILVAFECHFSCVTFKVDVLWNIHFFCFPTHRVPRSHSHLNWIFARETWLNIYDTLTLVLREIQLDLEPTWQMLGIVSFCRFVRWLRLLKNPASHDFVEVFENGRGAVEGIIFFIVKKASSQTWEGDNAKPSPSNCWTILAILCSTSFDKRGFFPFFLFCLRYSYWCDKRVWFWDSQT